MKTVILLACLLLLSCQTLTPVQDTAFVLQEDFSTRRLRWETYVSNEGALDVEDGVLRILAIEPDTFFIAIPRHLSFGNVRIQVEARRITGVQDNLFGILCRYQDAGNYYQLLISSDGYYDISKVKDGERLPLIGDILLPIKGFDPGSDQHHLQAECILDQLILSVDGVEVASARDSEFASGNVGLIAGALQPPGVEIHFDNLVVSKP